MTSKREKNRRACPDCRNKDTEIDTLRRQIATKNMAIEDLRSATPTGLRELSAAFPHLRPLLEVLQHGHQLQDPVRSPAPDPGRRGGGDAAPEGQGTRQDRERVRSWDLALKRMVDRLRRDVGDTEPRRPLADLAPRCRRKGCDMQDRRQAFDATVCRSCQRPFASGPRTDHAAV